MARGNDSNWTLVGTSAANTAKTITKPTPSNQQLVITAYLVVIRAAAAGADISVALTDQNDTVLWQDYIGNAASRGDRCGFSWPEGKRFPGATEINLVVGAGGASCITELNLSGRVE